MEKIIAARHMVVSDQLKEFILHELTKIEEDYRKLTSVRVVLDSQRNWHTTEIILHGKNIVIEANAKSKELHSSITNATAKTRKQLKRHLDKIRSHHSHKSVKKELVTELESVD